MLLSNNKSLSLSEPGIYWKRDKDAMSMYMYAVGCSSDVVLMNFGGQFDEEGSDLHCLTFGWRIPQLP